MADTEIRVFITKEAINDRVQSIEDAIKQNMIEFCENVLKLENVEIDLKVIDIEV